MPERNDFSTRIPVPFVRSNYPPPLRAEYYSGDTIPAGATLLIAHSALLGINHVTNSKGVIAGPMDGIPDVGVGGRSDARFSVGIYGYSENGTGVHCKSETYEALHAETNSTETAAIAAYQLNTRSNSAALFARHEGGGAAAVFEGDVHINGRIFVNRSNPFALLARVESLEGKLVTLHSGLVDAIRNLEQDIATLHSRLANAEGKIQNLERNAIVPTEQNPREMIVCKGSVIPDGWVIVEHVLSSNCEAPQEGMTNAFKIRQIAPN